MQPGAYRAPVPVHAHETFEERERRIAEERGIELDLAALTYVNDQYWGHEKLDEVNNCFLDVEDRPAALACIEGIIAKRVGLPTLDCLPERSDVVHVRAGRDVTVVRLMEVWGKVYLASGLRNRVEIGAVFVEVLDEYRRKHRRHKFKSARSLVSVRPKQRHLTL